MFAAIKALPSPNRTPQQSGWTLREYLSPHRQTSDFPQDDELLMKGPHHRTAKDLLVAVAGGCGICTRLKERMAEKKVRFSYSRDNCDFPWLKYELKFWFQRIHLFLSEYQATSETAQFQFTPLEWNRIVNRSDMQHLASDDTSDEAVFERAHLWLSDCLGHHAGCEPHFKSNYRPPRLLHLTRGEIRLNESHEPLHEGRYATLSYCWGSNPQHLTLTTRNLEILRNGIKVEHLPRTFRDAVQIAKKLNVQYLWIDALCILQAGEGSHNDWQKHTTEMSEIYANCVFNIAADHGDNAEAGCFISRDPDTIKPCIFNASPDNSDMPREPSQDVEVVVKDVYSVVDRTFWSTLLSENVLYHRGWVHQERLLSPRILHFGSQQLTWECKALFACETFPWGIEGSSAEWFTPFSYDTKWNQPEMPYWHHVVQAYSQTNLTNVQDRLPAIAGIAKRVSTDRGSEYAAGLFLADLPVCLMWRHYGGCYGNFAGPYRAPSWSWASREGSVYFFGAWHLSGATKAALCRIEHLSLDHIHEDDPFGQLKAGTMVITAPMVSIATDHFQFSPKEWVEKCQLAEDNHSEALRDLAPFRGHFYFDESPLAGGRPGTNILFLMHGNWGICGLLIVPVVGSNSWIQVGLCLLPVGPGRRDNDEKWLDNAMRCIKASPNTTIELE